MAEEVFKLPDDISRLRVRRLIRDVPRSQRDIERRLRYLELCIRQDVVPGAKGRKRERGYDAKQVPPNLRVHMDDLTKAVTECRTMLAADDIDGVRERLTAIDSLAHYMKEQVETVTPRARRSSAQGGKERAKVETQDIRAYVDAGHSYEQTARHFGMSKSAVAKRIQRNSS